VWKTIAHFVGINNKEHEVSLVVLWTTRSFTVAEQDQACFRILFSILNSLVSVLGFRGILAPINGRLPCPALRPAIAPVVPDAFARRWSTMSSVILSDFDIFT
jgi:hypothetical protein